jgi:hypothetical protein
VNFSMFLEDFASSFMAEFKSDKAFIKSLGDLSRLPTTELNGFNY